MKTAGRVFWALFALVLIVLGVLIYAVPSFKGAMTRTSVVEYGQLPVTDEIDCYIVRDETVYSAGVSGNINYYLEDGTQLRGGAKVLDISASRVQTEEGEARGYEDITARLGEDAERTTVYTARSSGKLSYFVDGYENFFKAETMRNLAYDTVAGLDIKTKNLVRGNAVEGEPLYKICKTSKWYLLAWTNAENVSKYTLGKSMEIRLPEGEVRAELTDISEDGERWRLIFETNRYYEGFGGERALPASVLTSDDSGVIIENKSITTNEGRVGVYVKTKKGDFVFTPIKVISSDGINSAVEMSYYYDEEGKRVSTVDNYDEILKNPDAA